MAAASARRPDLACAAVEAELERRLVAARLQRRDGVATGDELQDLLDALPATWRAKILTLLFAHLDLGGLATAAEIGARAGKSVPHVWWAYERFGRKVASALEAPPPKSVPPEQLQARPLLTFSQLTRSSFRDDWSIRLRPEIREALGRLRGHSPRRLTEHAA
ncbi:MAG: hypothetical protein ACK41C_02740 [Phenylobacterium sp.]|uniref:hypothetical protein n=1 Tax=Phenylobacterium sp. TaxID=1871053 RepID=UPI0039199648